MTSSLTIKTIAEEIAPQLDAAISNALDGDPETRDNLIEVLWDNKTGILRVLQAVMSD